MVAGPPGRAVGGAAQYESASRGRTPSAPPRPPTWCRWSRPPAHRHRRRSRAAPPSNPAWCTYGTCPNSCVPHPAGRYHRHRADVVRQGRRSAHSRAADAIRGSRDAGSCGGFWSARRSVIVAMRDPPVVGARLRRHRSLESSQRQAMAPTARGRRFRPRQQAPPTGWTSRAAATWSCTSTPSTRARRSSTVSLPRKATPCALRTGECSSTTAARRRLCASPGTGVMTTGGPQVVPRRLLLRHGRPPATTAPTAALGLRCP